MQKRPFIESKYNQLEVIGAGALGPVTQYIDRSQKLIFALKSVENYSTATKPTGFHMYKRLNSLADIKCDFVSKINSYEIEKNTFQILFDYIEGNNLSKCIGPASESNGLGLDATGRLKVLYGTAYALKCLHDIKHAHTNLKLGNIIIKPKTNIPVLTHGGICGVLGINIANLEANVQKLNPADLPFIAPELSELEDIDSEKMDCGCYDIYSFGVLMCEMISDNIFENDVEVPQFLNETEKNFINKCLSKTPTDRPDINSVLEFLKNSKDNLFIDGNAKGPISDDQFTDFINFAISGKSSADKSSNASSPTKRVDFAPTLRSTEKNAVPTPSMSQNMGSRFAQFQQKNITSSHPKPTDDSDFQTDEKQNASPISNFSAKQANYQNDKARKSMVCDGEKLRQELGFLMKQEGKIPTKPVEDEDSLKDAFKQVLAMEKEAKMADPAARKNIARLYKVIADKGYQYAQVKYAMLVFDDNANEAEKYYKYALDQGNSDALNNYGCIEETKNNIKSAKECYKSAADKGNPHGLNNYGRMLELESNISEAKKYYQKAADLNDSEGIANLAKLLEDEAILRVRDKIDFDDINVSSDIEKVKELYSKSESKMAQNNLGLIKLGFLGTVTNLPSHPFKPSAIASSTASTSSTASSSDNNDYKEGINHLLKAAALNSKEAQFNLAYINNDTAAYKKLAMDDKERNRNLVTPAINNFAVEIVAQSQFFAAGQFMKAANDNNPYSQINYGIVLLNGIGMDGKKQEAEAIKQFMRAKDEHNLSEAFYNLAYCHDHGINGPPKKALAKSLYQDAIKRSYGKNIRATRAFRAANT